MAPLSAGACRETKTIAGRSGAKRPAGRVARASAPIHVTAVRDMGMGRGYTAGGLRHDMANRGKPYRAPPRGATRRQDERWKPYRASPRAATRPAKGGGPSAQRGAGGAMHDRARQASRGEARYGYPYRRG